MYVIIIKYLIKFEEIEKYLVDHRKHLKSYYANGDLVCSGPQDSKTGGLVISNFKSEDQVNNFIENDPFCINKVAEYETIKFNPVLMADEIQDFLKKDVL